MIYEFNCAAKNQNIDKTIEFIEDKLKLKNYSKSEVLKCLLSCEEMMIQMLMKANEDSTFKVTINNKKKHSLINISCKGEKCDISTNATIKQVGDLKSDDDEKTLVISKFILKSLNDKITLKYHNGYNKAQIKIKEKETDGSFLTLLCLLLGLIFGFIFKCFIPSNIGDFIENNIFTNITTIFLNSISMIVGPLVFFSISEGVTGFSDIKTFGKVGGKVMLHYFLTTLISLFISISVFLLFSPGNESLMPSVLKMFDHSIELSATNVNLIDTFVNMFPSNFINSFVEGDMLQIIVLAILFGYSAGRIGQYSDSVINFIKAGNAIFSKITTVIVQILPLAIFSMSFSLIYYLDFSSIGEIANLYLCTIICSILMVLVYASLIFFEGKYNPIKFFNKFKKAMITAFTTSSSGVTMPITMKCLDDIGVSSKLYSFTIPLGATVNMDGAAMSFTLGILFMCKIFGIEINLEMLIPLIISIIVFSFGAPCIAGAGVAFTAMLLVQVGIPVGALAFIVPILAIIEFVETVLNVTGDGAVTIAVAKKEGLIKESN